MATGKDPVVFYNVDQWLEDNSKFFSPPVCNKMMHNAGQMKSFFVGGPNQRKDYHIEVGEELFYMLKGDMCLKVVEHGRHRDVHIKEGEIFLLPGKIAHSPQRQADTVGLVIERERAETELDGLRYFVEKDGKPTLESLYEDWFHCTDLGTQLPPVIKRFFASEQCKTGKPVPGTIPVAPPVVLDSERSLQEPFLLSEWIARNRDEIRSQGSKRLFGNGYQFQVDVLGCGETSGGHDVAETWIWQLEGSASVKVGEKSYSLGANDSLLIKAGQRYTVQQNKEGIALSCFQDPSRA